jgi:ubiquinone/menaquinone biosynthesis C-methylase UbiE
MSTHEILRANHLYHDDEAAHYDEGQPYMRNAFAQKMFQADIRAILDALAPFNSAPRVLDCGAGTGNLSLKFLESGCNVTAVDISQEMLNRLRRKAAAITKGSLETVYSDIDSFLQSVSQRYDVVCSSSFLHHVPDYPATYQAMAGVCSEESIIYTAFEPRARRALNPAQRLFASVDNGIHEFAERRLYNPWIVARAVLRRLHVLPTPRQVINDVDLSLVERPELGIDTDTLRAASRPAGFTHASFCWRPVSRYPATYFLNKRLFHLDNALFMISQRSVSGRQRPLSVLNGVFR